MNRTWSTRKTDAQDYLTMPQLAAHFRVSRQTIEARLLSLGLCTAARVPSAQAIQRGVCRVLPTYGQHTLPLWNWRKIATAIRAAQFSEADEALGDWATPYWLFDLLDAEFHFTLDVAATSYNAKCRRFFTEADDGLAQDWSHETVWCNPPWSTKGLGEWVRKAWQESRNGTTVVLLIPHWKGYEWFDKYCIAYGKLRNIMGKVCFKGANGKAAAKDCVVVVFGPDVKGYTNGPSIRRASSQIRQSGGFGR